MSSRHRVIIAGLFMVTVTACAEDFGPGTDPEWRAERSSHGTIELADTRELCSTCLSLSPVVVLGEVGTEPAGLLSEYRLVDAIARDPRGRYWLGQRDGVKVFDAQGKYLRNLAPQGQGPGDVTQARWLHTDSNERVHIVDVLNARESIFTDEMTLLATRPIPAGSILDAAPLRDGERWVVKMFVGTVDRVGFPLHVIDGEDVLYSFGIATDGTAPPLTPITAQRILATDDEDYIYSINPYQYPLEIWTPMGERVRGLKGEPLNDSMPTGSSWSTGNPPRNRVFDLRVYDRRYLILGTWMVRDNWADLMEERIEASGRVSLEPKGNDSDLFRTRLELIDLQETKVIARLVLEEFVFRLMQDGLVASNRYGDDGEFSVQVSSLSIRTQE